MDWQDRYYPPDVFNSLINQFDSLIVDGRLVSVELVEEEIAKMGSSHLASWALSRKDIFDARANHLAEALKIEGQFPALKDPNALFDEADAYVIARARLSNGTVVTAETSASHKRKPKRSMYIPDVCAALGIPCITNLGLMRREAWVI